VIVLLDLPENQILCGAAQEVLNHFPLDSIDVIMTSPPYWALRNYGHETIKLWNGDLDCEHVWTRDLSDGHTDRFRFRAGKNSDVGNHLKKALFKKPAQGLFCEECGGWIGQLGLEPHPRMYMNHLVQVFQSFKRVLKPTGTFWLVMGDTFFGGGRGQKFKNPCKQMTSKGALNYAGIPPQKSDGSQWLRPKQLMLIPTRLAALMQDDGWLLRNKIIWYKHNHMPSSVKDRFTCAYEEVFMFSKGRRYFFDLDNVRMPHTSLKDIGRKRHDTPTPKHDTGAREQDLNPGGYIGQHPLGKNPGDVVTAEQLSRGPLAMPIDRSRDVMRLGHTGHALGKNPGDVVATYKSKFKPGKHGQTLQAFVRVQSTAQRRAISRRIARQLFPGDVETQKKYIAYIHDHDGHPLGKNPGDVFLNAVFLLPPTKHDQAVDRVGKGAYDDPLHNKSHHPLGKNPSDVVIPGSKRKYGGHSEFNTRGIEAGTSEQYHPLGKNPGDLWRINTKPFKGAHFATFPPALVELVLKAGCPEQVCVKCGRPRVRVTKVIGDSSASLVTKLRKKVEWQSCKCDAGFQPGVLLDPFAGAGTSCLMARDLGFRYIGVDLNPTYVQLAQQRLSA